jgi:uncharacterized delta-60 repeat protein
MNFYIIEIHKYILLFHQFQWEVAMKKIYVLLAAAFFMLITGCGSSEAPLSSAKAITAFKISYPIDATGVITEATHTIAITVPYNTPVTNLVATFTTTGASVKVGSDVQTSGTTPNNFTSSVDYIVTAADASTQDYSVTVTVSPRSGSLDTTFGSDGKVITPIGSSNDYALALGIQSDGRIVTAGYTDSGSNYDFALIRYNTNGTLDTTFGSAGLVTTFIGSGPDVANALGIQSDGKIVAAGYSHDGSYYKFALVRYNTDGSLDKTFGTGGIVTTLIEVGAAAFSLGIQSDGKIVVAGYSFGTSNKHNFALVRYNTDGSLDETFGTGGIVTTSIESLNDYASDLVIQSDGKIVVAGYSYNSSENSHFTLARYNENGSLDTGFGAGGIVTTAVGSNYDYAHALGIQPDGKIVVAGSSSTSSKYNFALARYNANGTLDTGFGTGGVVTTALGSNWDAAYDLGIQSDGKIVAAGYSGNGSNYDFALVRYNENGSLDTGFGAGGIVTTPIGNDDDKALALSIQSNGEIVAAGYSVNGSNYDFALVRYWSSEAP